MKIIIGKPFESGIGCFEPILGCFILFILAYTAAKMNILNINIGKKLHTMATRILLPIFMITAFQIPRTMNNSVILFDFLLIALLTTAAFAAISMICYKNDVSNISKSEQYSMTFSDHAAFGIPVMYAYGGKYGLFFCAAFIFVGNIAETLYGDMIMKKGTGKRVNPMAALFSPVTLCAVLGLLLYFIGISLPTVVTNAMNTAGMAASPIIIMVLGIIAAKIDLKPVFTNTKILVLCAIKMFLFPMIIFALCMLFKLDKGITYVSMTLSALPCASSTFFKSERFGSRFTAAAASTLTSVVYLFSLPILTYIAMALLPLK